MALSAKEQARKAAYALRRAKSGIDAQIKAETELKLRLKYGPGVARVAGRRAYSGPDKIDRSSPYVIPSSTKQGPVTQTWGKPEVIRTVAKQRESTTGSCPHWMPTESKRFPKEYDRPKTRWNMAGEAI